MRPAAQDFRAVIDRHDLRRPEPVVPNLGPHHVAHHRLCPPEAVVAIPLFGVPAVEVQVGGALDVVRTRAPVAADELATTAADQAEGRRRPFLFRLGVKMAWAHDAAVIFLDDARRDARFVVHDRAPDAPQQPALFRGQLAVGTRVQRADEHFVQDFGGIELRPRELLGALGVVPLLAVLVITLAQVRSRLVAEKAPLVSGGAGVAQKVALGDDRDADAVRVVAAVARARALEQETGLFAKRAHVRVLRACAFPRRQRQIVALPLCLALGGSLGGVVLLQGALVRRGGVGRLLPVHFALRLWQLGPHRGNPFGEGRGDPFKVTVKVGLRTELLGGVEGEQLLCRLGRLSGPSQRLGLGVRPLGCNLDGRRELDNHRGVREHLGVVPGLVEGRFGLVRDASVGAQGLPQLGHLLGDDCHRLVLKFCALLLEETEVRRHPLLGLVRIFDSLATFDRHRRGHVRGHFGFVAFPVGEIRLVELCLAVLRQRLPPCGQLLGLLAKRQRLEGWIDLQQVTAVKLKCRDGPLGCVWVLGSAFARSLPPHQCVVLKHVGMVALLVGMVLGVKDALFLVGEGCPSLRHLLRLLPKLQGLELCVRL
mmetsp:Transcript_29983/g.78645  ORF Transcript_29983/g.78645 Transcript_29983/m.78645 type:complete len:596 (-) Transcript_29983:548-2335(-)